MSIHPTNNKNLIAALLISLGLGSACPSNADDQQRLEQIRRDINELRQNLSGDKKQLNKLQNDLKQLEKDIARLNRALRKTEQKLKKQSQTQQQLRHEASTLSQTLEEQRSLLSQQIRTGYSAGQQQAIKMLLNQTNPAEAGRTLTYYGYFTRAQLKTVEETRIGLQQLQNANEKLQRSTTQLTNLRNEQRDQQKMLEKSTHERKIVLAKLSKEIKTKEQSLNQMVADEKTLSEILQDIPHSLPANTVISLKKYRGKLKWPSKGKIRHRYGEPRSQNRVKWQGVLIQGKEGDDIQAIAPGQVVFADWIRGYGLLMILDHGHGYMSLYGHTQSLYKDVGDHVSANEVVASVGSSGGNADQGLYFELRHNGKAINPHAWFR